MFSRKGQKGDQPLLTTFQLLKQSLFQNSSLVWEELEKRVETLGMELLIMRRISCWKKLENKEILGLKSRNYYCMRWDTRENSII